MTQPSRRGVALLSRLTPNAYCEIVFNRRDHSYVRGYTVHPDGQREPAEPRTIHGLFLNDLLVFKRRDDHDDGLTYAATYTVHERANRWLGLRS